MSRKSGLLLTLVASLIWGTTFTVSQIAFQFTNPYNLVFLRFATASAGIIILAFPLENKLNLKRELSKKAIWLLSGVYAIGFILQYVGQDLTTASEASLLSNLAPILVPMIAFIALRDLVTNAQKAAIALGFLGLFLIASPRLDLGSVSVLGDLMLLGTSICYATFIILSKRMSVVTFASSLAITLEVTLLLAPVAVSLGGLNPFDLKIEPVGWASIFYLGYPCTIVALAFYLKGLGSISPSESAILLLFQVLTALILAVVFLKEFLGLSQVIGALAIMLALALGTRINRRDKLGKLKSNSYPIDIKHK